MTKNRLSKILAASGIASRRASEDLIFNGFVTVNGTVVTIPQTLVDPSEDSIEYQGRPVQLVSSFVYYKLNKPKGFVCSHKKFGNEKLIYELLHHHAERLFCIGRLDKDTEGLILLTNDGSFANKVIHPSSNVEKEYIATVTEVITPAHLRKIAAGATVEDHFIKPHLVKLIDAHTIRIVVKEGKKREVRKFIESAFLEIEALKRVRIGRLTLGSLTLGHYESLTSQDKESIFQCI